MCTEHKVLPRTGMMATKYVYLFPHIWCLWLCCFIVGKCVKSTYKNNVINSTHGLIGVDPCEKTFCITRFSIIMLIFHILVSMSEWISSYNIPAQSLAETIPIIVIYLVLEINMPLKFTLKFLSALFELHGLYSCICASLFLFNVVRS